MNRRQFLRASSIFSAATLVSFSTWAAGSENEVVLNLDPTRDNPRNSEGAFVTLKSGRILFIYTRFNGGAADESPAQLASIQSDDGGRTWSREPRTVVELADGRLFSWMRTDQGAHFGCYSTDSGKRWSPPARTDLVSPASPASIKRLPGSADLVALYNDHSGRFPFPKGKRSPLVAAVSSDGGKTWPCRKLLEGDPAGWYCYTAIHFTEDAMLLAYCAGDPQAGYLNRLRLRRVGLGWLKEI